MEIAARVCIASNVRHALCDVLAPYALVTGLSRVGDVEDVEREVAAREALLVQHEARAVRF